MKPISASIGLTLFVCATAFGQSDRIVVPAGNSSHPRVVTCNLLNGSIRVKTHSGGEVFVDGDGFHASEESRGGMHRIGVSDRGLEAAVDDNVITIRDHSGNRSVYLTVPVDTSLKLHTLSGGVDVDGVRGELEVHSSNGRVTLNNISGTVNADTQNGEIRVTMDRVDSSKPMAFSTLNGLIDLTLPADLKADLTVKTSHGEVYSDFDVTLGGSRAVTERNGNTYRIRNDNTIRGSIGGGGVDLTIRSLNGGVYIRKKK